MKHERDLDKRACFTCPFVRYGGDRKMGFFPLITAAAGMKYPLVYIASSFLVNWYIDIYTNVYGADTTYADIIEKFNGYLKHMINDNPVASAFTNIILAIGLIMMLYYFFSDLSAKAMANQLSTLQVGKSFCTALGTVFVIFYSKQIFIFMLTFVEALNGEFIKMQNGSTAVSKILGNEIVQVLLSRCVSDHFSIGATIGYTLAALLLVLASLATRLYVTYFAVTRIIQLFVYYIFAPIGVADIFENDIGGTINFQSSGFRYIKTMFAIMLQLVVVTIICQVYPMILTTINTGYFIDQGDSTLKLDDNDVDIENNYAAAMAKNSQAALYPINNFEYTDHKANIVEVVWEGANNIRKALKAIGAIVKDDDNIEIDEDNKKDKLKESEKYKLVGKDGIIKNTGRDVGEIKEESKNEAEKIMKNTRYRMTVESTERFFKWCIGADGGKMILFVILLATKVLMIHSSAKLCSYITNTNV